MRRPVVAAMSCVSAAVLGLSLHASQRTSPVAVGAAPAGLVETPGTVRTTRPAPSAARTPGPTGRAATLPGQPAAHSAAAVTPRASTSARSPKADASPSGTPPRARKATSNPAPSAASRPTAKPTVSTVVVNGSPADTPYGPVQVQITLRGGHIIKADAIDYPRGGGRDQEINGQAIPQLDHETVQADSAQIDTVSGATYTSGGYRQSLQSALDAAHQAGAR